MGVFSELLWRARGMEWVCARNLVAGWPGIRGLGSGQSGTRALWRITVGIARRSRTIQVNGGL
jgi:hypothetical protein